MKKLIALLLVVLAIVVAIISCRTEAKELEMEIPFAESEVPEVPTADIPISEWNKFRREVTMMSLRLKEKHEMPFLTENEMYDALMKTFYAECKWQSDATNKISNAKGIIQWMPAVAKKMNMPADFHLLPMVDQLPYVEEYYDKWLSTKLKGVPLSHLIGKYKDSDRYKEGNVRYGHFIDIYLVVFSPGMFTKSPLQTCYKACSKGKKGRNCCGYHANSAYDLNGDGHIVKAEIARRIVRHYL